MAEVYALKHPDTGAFWYIGSTAGSSVSRYRYHLSRHASHRVRRWVSFLRAQGKEPVLEVLAVTTLRRARRLEQHLIGSDRSLLNSYRANVSHHHDFDRMVSISRLTTRKHWGIINDPTVWGHWTPQCQRS